MLNLPSILELAESFLSTRVFHKKKFTRTLRLRQNSGFLFKKTCVQSLDYYFAKNFLTR